MGDLVLELMTQLRLIPELQFVTIWNNQFDYIEDGKTYSFPFPCAFVEIISDNFGQLGNRYQGVDVQVKIHLGQEFYNGSNMDENLTIYSLRDKVVQNLSLYKASKTGPFTKINEQQDYDHNNIYHYELTYAAHWIDDAAVIVEPTLTGTTWTPIISGGTN